MIPTAGPCLLMAWTLYWEQVGYMGQRPLLTGPIAFW
jgi:hypothetical protein